MKRLAACSGGVLDWSGGTRIAPSLAAFNREWGRAGARAGRRGAADHRRP